MIGGITNNGFLRPLHYVCSHCLLRLRCFPALVQAPIAQRREYATSARRTKAKATDTRAKRKPSTNRPRKPAVKLTKVDDGRGQAKGRRRQSSKSTLRRKRGSNDTVTIRKLASQHTEDTVQDGAPHGITLEAMGQSLKRSIGTFSDGSLGQRVVQAKTLALDVLDIKHAPIPKVKHGIEKVLFNPGVYEVRDRRSRVYNFDPSIEELMSIKDFDFDSLSSFVAPSKDLFLEKTAKRNGKKYIGSTSSMTGALKHFHLLLSRWRPLNLNRFSRSFKPSMQTFTVLSRAPDAIFLRYKNGVYAIDADKQFDSPNVLSLMGRFMEKLLTVGKERFELHRKGKSHLLSEAARDVPEAYHYSTIGDFLLRSQLDAHDSRLPGTGVFDLKTRVVTPIRFSVSDFEWGMDWEIWSRTGDWTSYEREYYDMIRSTMLKYSLQVRMGRMDGILVAYHNIRRIFGFQYVSLDEMDESIHGQSDTTLGNQEFLTSLKLMNKVLDKATKRFPKQSIRLHFESRDASKPFMYIFAEPVTEDQANTIQSTNKEKIEQWEREIMGLGTHLNLQTDSSASKKDMPRPVNVEGDVTSDYLSEGSVIDSGTVTPFETSGDDSSKSTSGVKQGTTLRNGNIDTRVSADKELLLDIEERSKGEIGPVLGLVLTTQSVVNGKNVNRPANPFTQEDKWDVHYTLAEIEKDTRAWTLLQACKERRQSAFLSLQQRKDEATGSPENDPWLLKLKDLAVKSKEKRDELDAKDIASGANTNLKTWNKEHRKTSLDADKGVKTPGPNSKPSADKKFLVTQVQATRKEIVDKASAMLSPNSQFPTLREQYGTGKDAMDKLLETDGHIMSEALHIRNTVLKNPQFQKDEKEASRVAARTILKTKERELNKAEENSVRTTSSASEQEPANLSVDYVPEDAAVSSTPETRAS